MDKPKAFAELAELIKPRTLYWEPANPKNYGYKHANGSPVNCTPRAFCWHTPEETADDNEVTPRWFQNPAARASTHFYADNDGDLYWMVALDVPPYANGVTSSIRTWKGQERAWAPWNKEHYNYNWITASCEVEGFGKSMHLSLTKAQWETCIKLGWWVGNRYGFPADRIHHFEHREVATNKRDPGTFPTNLLVEEIAAYRAARTVPGHSAGGTWSPELQRHLDEHHK